MYSADFTLFLLLNIAIIINSTLKRHNTLKTPSHTTNTIFIQAPPTLPLLFTPTPTILPPTPPSLFPPPLPPFFFPPPTPPPLLPLSTTPTQCTFSTTTPTANHPYIAIEIITALLAILGGDVCCLVFCCFDFVCRIVLYISFFCFVLYLSFVFNFALCIFVCFQFVVFCLCFLFLFVAIFIGNFETFSFLYYFYP